MSVLNDFTALMSDVQNCQQELAALHAKITHPEEKAMMGQLLTQIEDARLQAVTVVPATLQQIQDSARNSAAQAEQHLAEIAQRRKQLQAQSAAAAADAKVPPAPKPKQEVRVDPKLGPTLRLELLQRFGQQSDGPNRPAEIKEAWEDWQ